MSRHLPESEAGSRTCRRNPAPNVCVNAPLPRIIGMSERTPLFHYRFNGGANAEPSCESRTGADKSGGDVRKLGVMFGVVVPTLLSMFSVVVFLRIGESPPQSDHLTVLKEFGPGATEWKYYNYFSMIFFSAPSAPIQHKSSQFHVCRIRRWSGWTLPVHCDVPGGLLHCHHDCALNLRHRHEWSSGGWRCLPYPSHVSHAALYTCHGWWIEIRSPCFCGRTLAVVFAQCLNPTLPSEPLTRLSRHDQSRPGSRVWWKHWRYVFLCQCLLQRALHFGSGRSHRIGFRNSKCWR